MTMIVDACDLGEYTMFMMPIIDDDGNGGCKARAMIDVDDGCCWGMLMDDDV